MRHNISRNLGGSVLMRLSVAGLLLMLSDRTAVAQISRFEHIVVIVQENRTPDNLFQGLCAPPFGSATSCSTSPTASQYDIKTRRWLDKTSLTGVRAPQPISLVTAYDLSHIHSSFIAMCDPDSGGASRMDGAAGVPCIGTCVTHPQFRYVDNSTGLVNPYLSLATQYGWANYMFQSNQGASFAAHQFIFSGTSALSAADDAAGIFAQAIIPGPGNQAGKVAGCIAPAGALSSLIGPPGTKMQRIYPCFEHLTMPDLLPANFSWRYYTPSASSIWTAPNAIQHICQSSGPGEVCTGPEWTTNLDLKPSDVLQDIANCNLRSVSWVIPDGRNSDHAKGSGPGGPSWVASIVNAIGGSSTCDANTGYWHNTTIFITWDDWGGWYDHEAPSILPGPQGDYQLGLRVPLIA